jgi:hypothetical protein
VKIILLAFIFAILSPSCFGQSDSVAKVSFSAYAEAYYSYDFSEPLNHEKPSFIYNHKRHNEFDVNLLFVKAKYSEKNIRANLALMAGNYAQYNLSSEPVWAQYLYEANFGFRLSKKKSVWLEAGIFPSHIGFESAVAADCRTLTRSILAENSPYYESGLRLLYTSANEKLNLGFYILNGWQKIQRPSHINRPSFGAQLNYKASDKLLLNYSNFVGVDKPDSLNAWRVFHNFYAIVNPIKKLEITMGFDIGTDKDIASKYGYWFSPVLISRWQFNGKWAIALRGEYYQDKNQIIVFTGMPNGFQVAGYSTNIDFSITDKILFRVEGKMYSSINKIFAGNKKENYSVTSSLSVKLG